jgi:hypothetical protein
MDGIQVKVMDDPRSSLHETITPPVQRDISLPTLVSHSDYYPPVSSLPSPLRHSERSVTQPGPHISLLFPVHHSSTSDPASAFVQHLSLDPSAWAEFCI